MPLCRPGYKKCIAYNGLPYCALLVLVFSWVFFGCATTTTLDKEPGHRLEIIYPDQLDARSFWPEESLEQVFAGYWTKRFAKADPEELMALEAPHFQEMVALQRYQAFMQNLPQGSIQEIEIASAMQVTEHLFVISMRISYICSKGEQRAFSLRDRWVQVQEKWYHLLRDPMIFPGLGQNYPGPKIYNLVSG